MIVVVALVMGSFSAAIVRIWLGPSGADRMMGAQLFGSSGAATVLVLAAMLNDWLLVDVALVFASLAAVTVVAFVERTERASSPE
ncbi:multiple resistance and pH regulation protein F [Lujinxingia vulgaris]|uniref:Multiple resistance and pH regulation protein F n=1 Tax=Lujinxingia vulgaris TaxID=2600176 RepID=A0A5C6XK98_9DELT|nr:monovalent cation/H+ antiporter complex subunit F [Lujinxingia vulgaris]TXD39370.1 multiple resistance and pH regulation protein F [Lujinxingia vulgaris]